MAVFSPQMMATQSGAQRKKRKVPYVDLIRGQHGQATQNVLAQRQQKQSDAEAAEQRKQSKRSYKLQKGSMKLQKDRADEAATQSKRAMGLSGAKLGLNLMNRFGNTQTGMGKFIGSKIGDTGFSLGKTAASGLIGAGAAQFAPVKKKWQKGAIGAAAGGLASYLSGGSGGSSLGGSVLGGLGGLF